MLILKAYKLLRDQNETLHMAIPKTVAKWKLPEAEAFGFDLVDPAQWREFLSQYTLSNGLTLPDHSDIGDPIVYIVFSRGRLPKKYAGYFPQMMGTNFFPGYDENDEIRDARIYGRIR